VPEEGGEDGAVIVYPDWSGVDSNAQSMTHDV